MNWLGQHIVDFIARFRSDVYLEDLTTDTSTDILVVDTDGKICKNADAGDDMTFTVTADSGADQTITDGNAISITGGDAITTTVSATDTVTIDHSDTSTQASVDNSGNTVIQDIQVDTYGHVTRLVSIDITSVDGATLAETAVLATTATNVTVAANNTADETVYPTFVDGATGAQGIETDTGLTYNPSTNVLTAVNFAGALAGNASGTAATVTAGTQAAITTCANLTTVGTIATGTWNAGIIAEGKLQNQSGTNTGDEPDAADDTKGIVELATTAEATTGTDTARAVTAAGVAAVHATTQSGKSYRIINTSFRDDIQTTKHYLPLKSQDEQTALTREEGTELAVCDGRLVSATVRVESMQGTTGDFTLTMGVETNVVGAAYGNFTGTAETEAITVNTGDDHHAFHFVFGTDPHWSATDMFAVSIEASSDEWGSNERFFVTLVVEDDWSTYLAGSSREIDTTP